MNLEEFVKHALRDIAPGLNKAITEGAVAVAYADRVGVEVQVPSSFDGNAVICTRGEIAAGRLTFTVAADLGVSPFPEGERLADREVWVRANSQSEHRMLFHQVS